jgi:DNA polymerase elongation subunit (family B)
MDNQQLQNILFLDIETVSCVEEYSLLNERIAALWDKKSGLIKKNEDEFTSAEMFTKRAAIYAEFGKIVTIAVGIITIDDNKEQTLRIKAFADDDETKILQDFKNLVEKKFNQSKLILCAHNGREFDFPYMCRRFLINQIPIPQVLQLEGKKPWEIMHIDTMELWKFGDRKSYTSLDLLAAIFDIESSKDDIDGSMVHEVYYKNKQLDRIAQYCMQDVLVTAQLFLKLNCLPVIPEERVVMLD